MCDESSILIVDDSALFREMLEGMLKTEGFDVRAAESGRQAVALLEEWRPMVIVSDWMMPEMNGLELLEHVRGHEDLKSLHFIILTARGKVEDALQALELGADDFINKSADPREVLVRIKVGLRIARLMAALQEAERKLTVVDIAATLSHEIFNPLQIISGFAEIMIRDPEMNEKRRGNAEQILTAAERVRKLVQTLKELKSPERTTYLGDVHMINAHAGEGEESTGTDSK